MFNNVVKLQSGSSITQVAIVDGPTNRRTKRASADGKTEFSIAHGESNENPGQTTQRSNVRVTETVSLPDSDKTVDMYAQLTMSFPKDHVTAAEVATLVARLVTFLAKEDNSSEVGLVEGSSLAAVPRLYAGEP